MHVDVRVPNEYTGDVMSDLNGKRARILGMEPASESHHRDPGAGAACARWGITPPRCAPSRKGAACIQ